VTGGWAATNTLSEALHDGLEYFVHELDDVTGAVHAISPQAKKYDAGLDALALVEAALDAAVDDLMADGYPVNDPDLDGRDDPAYKDELVRQWGPKKVALAAALRAVREGK
jgi:hypothetical protein